MSIGEVLPGVSCTIEVVPSVANLEFEAPTSCCQYFYTFNYSFAMDLYQASLLDISFHFALISYALAGDPHQ